MNDENPIKDINFTLPNNRKSAVNRLLVIQAFISRLVIIMREIEIAQGAHLHSRNFEEQLKQMEHETGCIMSTLNKLLTQ